MSKRLLALIFPLFLITGCEHFNFGEDRHEHMEAADMDQIEDLENRVGDRVFFEFDSSSITSEGRDVLRKQAMFMMQNPELHFVVEGHADERGTREYNLALGERRASAAKSYLMSLGVSGHRLTTVSYGKERPAVLGSNEWAWGQNRRAVTTSR